MDSVDLFRKHGVAFNTITTVNNRNSRMPLRVYHFLKDMGSRYMQFIPIVEREKEDKEGRIQPMTPGTSDAWVTEESVEPLLWGKFLSRIFDEWVRIDIGMHYVNYFDNNLAPYIDEVPPLCTSQLTCGAGPVMEHNGDVYACDHYVYPEFLLGNIQDVPLISGIFPSKGHPYAYNCTGTTGVEHHIFLSSTCQFLPDKHATVGIGIPSGFAGTGGFPVKTAELPVYTRATGIWPYIPGPPSHVAGIPG